MLDVSLTMVSFPLLITCDVMIARIRDQENSSKCYSFTGTVTLPSDKYYCQQAPPHKMLYSVINMSNVTSVKISVI